jgi:hypothetical protein
MYQPPRDAEAAAHIACALFEALTEALLLEGTLTENQFRAILQSAEARLKSVPSAAGARAAEFVRNEMLGDDG